MSGISVLVAPDKFKGSLTAREVADSLRTGLMGAGENLHCTQLPLADGGDGSVEAAVAAGFERVPLIVTGPTGEPVATSIAFDGHTGVLEVASISGLSVLPGGKLRPLHATSFGVGEAIRFAVEHLNAKRVVVALGGSATTDGGAGMLHALDARFLDHSGTAVSPAPNVLADLREVTLDLEPLAGVELVGASDVTNPLLGVSGTATVFGPQKGATPEDVARLETALTHFRRLTDPRNQYAEISGAGSAGGLGFAILLLQGRLVSGADFFLDLLDFDAHAATADLIITGEGSLDEQTERGKLVSVVAQRSKGKTVIAVAGRSVLSTAAAAGMGLASTFTLTDRSRVDTSHDPQLSAQLLREIGLEIAEDIAAAGPSGFPAARPSR
ncbi:glycerate kinase [Microbacterium sp.]|jgi:glycerate kinase|uniref:glycerate kinase n=1 Tax=Microbacterium sp. TaxID=51671 RepID=UPI0037CA79F3